MIRILFLIPGLSEGGAEKVLRNLVNNMDQAKFDITVQTIDHYDPKQYLADGIHYKAINRCKTALGRKLFSYWFRLCAELKLGYSLFVKDNYDIEVAYLECGATKLIAQSTNKKAAKLAWVHCDLSRKEGMKESVEKVREQYRAFDQIVCVSEDVRTGFRKLYGLDFQTVVLHNIMDEEDIFRKAREPLESVPSETYLLAVGRLTQQKNFAHLVDTCGKLRSDGCRFHLDILGEGPERESLQRQIKGLHLESIVDLKGFTNNPYPYMKAADWIICSSRYEGISTVVQEALILGKPVVTTPCTGMKELLGDSEFGLIAEDSEDGLYCALKKLMDDPALEQQYAEKAQERGAVFMKKNMVCETEKFLISLLAK